MIDKDTLLSKTRVVEHSTVTIPGVGDVKVRGLTRAEVIQVQGAEDMGDMERRTLVAGLVEPILTADEVAEWQDSAMSLAVDMVSGTILKLSRMLPGQDEETEARFRQG